MFFMSILQLITKRFLILIGICWSIGMTRDSRAQENTTKIHRQAHAHNDYLHPNPLQDALEKGFCSVEADIFLHEGQLVVAHTKAEIKPTRTLQALYLDPLKERVRKNAGNVHQDASRLTLLIDIKSEAVATYHALDRLLEQYSELFQRTVNGQSLDGPVIAIVSGNRPFQLIQDDKSRYVGIDGRLTDLDSDMPPELMPLISDNWTIHFRWRGVGNMTEAERVKLRSIVERAHGKQRRLRFWATPDVKALWQMLADENIDLINTDNLGGLSDFLSSRP
jgi:hypothetical protein